MEITLWILTLMIWRNGETARFCSNGVCTGTGMAFCAARDCLIRCRGHSVQRRASHWRNGGEQRWSVVSCCFALPDRNEHSIRKREHNWIPLESRSTFDDRSRIKSWETGFHCSCKHTEPDAVSVLVSKTPLFSFRNTEVEKRRRRDQLGPR